MFNIEIAGIRFSLKTKAEVTLQNPNLSHYKHFIYTPSEKTPADLEIQIELSDFDPGNHLTTIFDSDQSWSMRSDDNNFYISLHVPDNKKPFWTVKINSTFTKSTVYCSELIQKQGNTILNPLCYPLDQILLMHILAGKQGLLLHAAGAEINNKGYVFPGISGAGKSTLTNQFANKKNIKFLSDDRIAVRKFNNVFRMFGTPWPGEAGIALNESTPLNGIFFIRRGTSNKIKKIKANEALKNLMPVSSIPWYDRETVPELLAFCEDITSHIPAYELYFKPGKEVLGVIDEISLQ